MNLRVSKIFKFGSRLSATGFWEVFNLFNTDNFTSFQGSLQSSQFGQPQAEFPCRDAFVALRVFVDHAVDAGLVCATRLAEGHVLAGDVLQLDRDVLEHVAEPRAVVFAHTAEKAAGFPI